VYLPRGRRPLAYGIDERVPEGWIARFVHPFRTPAPRSVDGTGLSKGSTIAASSDEPCAPVA
jgi:hypothetical protein